MAFGLNNQVEFIQILQKNQNACVHLHLHSNTHTQLNWQQHGNTLKAQENWTRSKKSRVQQPRKHCRELAGFPAHGSLCKAKQRGGRREEEENK